jgi:hypothetical protein
MESHSNLTENNGSRIHLHTLNHKKYYFSPCNCLEHCDGTDGKPESSPQQSCPYCEGKKWSRSSNNIVDWGEVSESLENAEYDVYVPGSVPPGHPNDPDEVAVFDICKGDVENTPCEILPSPTPVPTPCNLGDTELGDSIGGAPGQLYLCVILKRASCPDGYNRIMEDGKVLPCSAARGKNWDVAPPDSRRFKWCGQCSCCQGGVSYCNGQSSDNAAVSLPAIEAGLAANPPVNWQGQQGHLLDIVAPGYGRMRETRQWGDLTESTSHIQVERYVARCTEDDGTIQMVDPGVPDFRHSTRINGWNHGWVRVFGDQANECPPCVNSDTCTEHNPPVAICANPTPTPP